MINVKRSCKYTIGVFLLFLSMLFIASFTVNIPVRGEEYRLQVDDLLYISVWGHPDLQQEALVGPDGEIAFPLIGEVKAEGKTPEELKTIITEGLAKYIKNPRVNVVLKEYRRLRVLVLGEFVKPGTYYLPGGKRVLDVISLAGGPRKVAGIGDLRLTRNDEVLKIDLEGLLKGENREQNYLLRDGDVLYLPPSIIEVTVLGEVQKQGRFKLEQGKRLSDLLALAGGLTKEADMKASITSGEEKIQVNLEELLAGKEGTNPVLKDGDTVFIPGTSYQVTIIGEVKKPGAYPWYQDLHLADLLAQAGNTTERGDLTEVKIVHNDKAEKEEAALEVVNLEDYLTGKEMAANPLLKPGDIVLVGEVESIDWEKVFFFVGGFNALKSLLGVDW